MSPFFCIKEFDHNSPDTREKSIHVVEGTIWYIYMTSGWNRTHELPISASGKEDSSNWKIHLTNGGIEEDIFGSVKIEILRLRDRIFVTEENFSKYFLSFEDYRDLKINKILENGTKD